jgi:hypothetical protein
MKYDGDDFGQDWEEVCRDQICDFHNYVSVDRDVATSGVSTVEELCEAYVSTRSVEEKNKQGENEDMVPSFAETYEALEKVRAFCYAHSVTDADRERILGLENSYFQLRKNCDMKQKTMYDYFRLKKSGVLDFSLSHIFRLSSPVPSKTKNREFTVLESRRFKRNSY